VLSFKSEIARDTITSHATLPQLPQFKIYKSNISDNYISNQAIFFTTFSIILDLLGKNIFIIWSRSFSSFEGVETTLNLMVLPFAGEVHRDAH